MAMTWVRHPMKISYFPHQCHVELYVWFLALRQEYSSFLAGNARLPQLSPMDWRQPLSDLVSIRLGERLSGKHHETEKAQVVRPGHAGFRSKLVQSLLLLSLTSR